MLSGTSTFCCMMLNSLFFFVHLDVFVFALLVRRVYWYSSSGDEWKHLNFPDRDKALSISLEFRELNVPWYRCSKVTFHFSLIGVV